MLDEDIHSVALKAIVQSKEFYGTYSQYKFVLLDSTIMNIEKEDGHFQLAEGDEVTLYLNPKDILHY